MNFLLKSKKKKRKVIKLKYYSIQPSKIGFLHLVIKILTFEKVNIPNTLKYTFNTFVLKANYIHHWHLMEVHVQKIGLTRESINSLMFTLIEIVFN